MTTKSNNFSGDSKVWIYQSSTAFKDIDVANIRHSVQQFTQQWTSHSQQLEAYGEIYHNRFIVFVVDQKLAQASGCSIDKSVKFIQQLEQSYGVDMFDRMNFAYMKDGEVKSANKEEFDELYRLGVINDDTEVFNNLVDNLTDFQEKWTVRLGDSWHKNLLSWETMAQA